MTEKDNSVIIEALFSSRYARNNYNLFNVYLFVKFICIFSIAVYFKIGMPNLLNLHIFS